METKYDVNVTTALSVLFLVCFFRRLRFIDSLIVHAVFFFWIRFLENNAIRMKRERERVIKTASITNTRFLQMYFNPKHGN